MDITRINEYWHLLEALKAGKELQLWDSPIKNQWNDFITNEINFISEPQHYRIKPEIPKGYVIWYKSAHENKWLSGSRFHTNKADVELEQKYARDDGYETRAQEVIMDKPDL